MGVADPMDVVAEFDTCRQNRAATISKKKISFCTENQKSVVLSKNYL
jgi:hypothetical protein